MPLSPAVHEFWGKHGQCLRWPRQGLSVSAYLCGGIFSSGLGGLTSFSTSTNRSPSWLQLLGGFCRSHIKQMQRRARQIVHIKSLGSSQEHLGTRSEKWWCKPRLYPYTLLCWPLRRSRGTAAVGLQVGLLLYFSHPWSQPDVLGPLVERGLPWKLPAMT